MSKLLTAAPQLSSPPALFHPPSSQNKNPRQKILHLGLCVFLPLRFLFPPLFFRSNRVAEGWLGCLRCCVLWKLLWWRGWGKGVQSLEFKVQSWGKCQWGLMKYEKGEGKYRLREGKCHAREGKCRIWEGKYDLREGKCHVREGKYRIREGKCLVGEEKCRIREGKYNLCTGNYAEKRLLCQIPQILLDFLSDGWKVSIGNFSESFLFWISNLKNL